MLSTRLQKIADIVLSLDAKCVCDVGTDHAYIPIYCVQHGIPKAIAVDVREGPLKIARENIARKGLADYIDTRLCDGLDNVGEGEADVIVISGMGGENIAEILERARFENATFILGPQSKIDRLKKRMEGAGYRVLNEEYIEEKNKKYLIIMAKWGALSE